MDRLSGLHIHWKAIGSVPSGKYIFNISGLVGTATGFVSVTNEPMPADMIAAVAAVRAGNANVPTDPLYVNIHSSINVDGAIAGRLVLQTAAASVLGCSFALLMLALVAIM
jgi:hypothetical protein